MHTRRMATFLLGIWIGCSALMALLAVENLRSAARVMDGAAPSAAKMIETLGTGNASLLLSYQAAEQTRTYLSTWENAQIALAVVLGACLFLGTQKRILPLAFCAAMLLLVLFQHFAVLPELAFRGRETDFPPGNAAFGARTRVLLLAQVYAGAEGLKILTGVVLTAYLFVFRAKKRVRGQSGSTLAARGQTAP
jgi:hypothetical protein